MISFATIWAHLLQDSLLKSVFKRVRAKTIAIAFSSVLMILSAIDLFNFNYNTAKGKATAAFIPLFGTGAAATSSTDTIPSGVVFGCQNCYAYAGVSFTFRSPMLMRATASIAAVLI